MIIDYIENFNKYVNLNGNFKAVLEFLVRNDLSELEPKKYEIKGEDVYLKIDEYQTKEFSMPEAHRKYIDIQIIVSGNEKIGYTDINSGESEIPYNEGKDVEFFNAECVYLKACPDKFFIFYPQDIHEPCITDKEQSQVRKAVFKVKI